LSIVDSQFKNISFWEKNTWLSNVDYCIIGSGIVGLNAAIRLKNLRPEKKVLVLERGILPTGASTKNAGFACFGSLSEIAADLEKMAEDEVLALIKRRVDGLALLRETLGDKKIDYHEKGGFELFTPSQTGLYEKCIRLKEKLNLALFEINGSTETYKNADSRIKEFGFDGVDHLIHNTAEGQIDTGKMMNALIKKASEAGVQILCGTEVTHWEDRSSGVDLYTNTFGSISCAKVIVATNGFAKQLLPDLDVDPGRAQVLITSPLPALPFSGCFHYDEGYYYFRDFENRILFGGGRNLDFKGETTFSHDTTEQIQSELEKLLREVILPGKSFEIEQRWAGTMGLGPVKQPIIKMVGNNIACAVRMGGMGVALGSLVGKEAAEMIIDAG